MKSSTTILASLVLITILGAGCVHAAKDTRGFAVGSSTEVEAPFTEAWQGVKAGLRAEELEIYTRDKRGVFVAYTPMTRRLFVPMRYEHTISLEPVNDERTAMTVETVRQVYGTTLLTHPGWHDRKTTDAALSQNLLEALLGAIAAD